MLLCYLLTAVIAAPFVCAAPFASRSTSDYPIANTSYGDVLGNTSEYRDGVYVFKGIPYAAPPTGSARWTAPSKPQSWTDVYNATVFGADCAQTYSSAGIFSSGSENISEDCLYLNVWTPTLNTSESLPVYLWIYGGRFEGGGGDVLTYDGSGLAIQDIVVVTFNYRLGPFGFLAHPDLSAESSHNSSGNYGLLDMVAAVEWVQAEIANFGGDPDHITVGGQSAGSASALDMMYSPLSSGRIAGVISESGARGPHDPLTGSLATSHRNKTAAEASGVEFLAAMNVSTIAELRNLSMDTLLTEDTLMDAIFEGTRFENLSAFSEPPEWRPVVDGYVLPYTYGEALRSGSHGNVPILTGNNLDESGANTDPTMTLESYESTYTDMFEDLASEFFALYPSSNDSSANGNASNALWQDISRISTWTWGHDWYTGGATENVYTYFWTHAPPGGRGVYHGSELYYVFNNIPYADTDLDWTEEDYAIEAVMTVYWANFIKTGDPNGGNLTEWPVSGDDNTTMFLGDSFGAELVADEARFELVQKFWTSLIEW
ncbi:carboxylesterase [Fistulina hepatica ATCC 64428]|uniref:Carboxylic ester hydrolase n=1 Tax=Fistulina hepatica ATCC 64428 TaxID=1128425 RepID=A0A0D7AEZ7_9AGAR|nr:carboxylesterase [Fistulina hepatica ATCC 64428]